MPINRQKAVSCYRDYKELKDQLSTMCIEGDLLEALINEQLVRDWGVSSESVKRYIRAGRQFEEMDAYKTTQDDMCDDYDHDEQEREEFIAYLDSLIEDDYNQEVIFPLMVIGDLHMPFEHKNALAFCCEVRDRYQPKTVVQIGDIYDHHALSRHQTETDAMSPDEERNAVEVKVQKWAKEFPEMKITIGNHDIIPQRQIKTLGLPKAMIPAIDKIYSSPDTWEFKTEHVVGGILFRHNIGLGLTSAVKFAQAVGGSVVGGHAHSRAGVMYWKSPLTSGFGAFTGCLCDEDTYAFLYGKDSKEKGILGCLMIHSPTHAEFIPMDGVEK